MTSPDLHISSRVLFLFLFFYSLGLTLNAVMLSVNRKSVISSSLSCAPGDGCGSSSTKATWLPLSNLARTAGLLTTPSRSTLFRSMLMRKKIRLRAGPAVCVACACSPHICAGFLWGPSFPPSPKDVHVRLTGVSARSRSAWGRVWVSLGTEGHPVWGRSHSPLELLAWPLATLSPELE